VDPVPDPLLLRKAGIARNRAGTFVFVAKSSDLETTEVIHKVVITDIIIIPHKPMKCSTT
jgi:hypothetical protein